MFQANKGTMPLLSAMEIHDRFNSQQICLTASPGVPLPDPLKSSQALRNQRCFLLNNDHCQSCSDRLLPLGQQLILTTMCSFGQLLSRCFQSVPPTDNTENQLPAGFRRNADQPHSARDTTPRASWFINSYLFWILCKMTTFYIRKFGLI